MTPIGRRSKVKNAIRLVFRTVNVLNIFLVFLFRLTVGVSIIYF